MLSGPKGVRPAPCGPKIPAMTTQQQTTRGPVVAAGRPDPVLFIDFPVAPTAAGRDTFLDTVEKLNAGAALTFALYHTDADLLGRLPGPVAQALARAQVAWGIVPPQGEGQHARR